MKLLKDTNFKIILGILVMAVMGGSIIGPILPAISLVFDVSDATVGWVLSVYTFFALVFTPILGIVADRIGRKKVLVPTTLIYGIVGVSISFAPNFYIVLVLRAIQGICVAGMMNLAVTLIGDLYEGRKRARAMGYRTSAQNFINATMPFVAGALATIAWFYPFYIYALSIPAGFFAIFKLEIKKETNSTTFSEYAKAALFVVRQHKTLWLFFSNFMLFFLLYCIVVYMPALITDKLGLSTLYAGLAITVAAGTSGLFSPHTGKLKGIIKTHYLVMAGFGLAGLSLLLISLSGNLIQVLLSLVLWGSGFALIMPTITTSATEQAPIHLRAGVMAVFTMMIYLGQTLSPPFFGFILKHAQLNIVFFSGAVIALLPVSYAIIEFIIEKKTSA